MVAPATPPGRRPDPRTGVVAVYARTTTVQARPSAVDQAVTTLRDDVMISIQQMDGNIGLSMLADRETGRCIVTSAWADRASMQASAQAVQPMRDRLAELMGGTPTIEEWEIAVLHRRRPSEAGAWCRVSWIQQDPAGQDAAVELYRTRVLDGLDQIEGFCSASLMLDRDSGRAVSSVTYDGRASLDASREAGGRLRSAVLAELSAELLDVVELELVLAHLRVPETV